MKDTKYALDDNRESFEYIRRSGKVFVDKTALMFDLIKHIRCGFVIRPPYFGKTLMHSMLTAYFQGKKELFKGLAIEKLETEWKHREVFYLDFTRGKFDQFGALNAYIDAHMTVWEHQYDCVPMYKHNNISRLHDLFERAKEMTGLQPVILIDGYDQPMLSALADRKVLEENRQKMMAFLTSFEGNAHGTDFFLVSGLTKFGLWEPFLGGFQSVYDFTTLDDFSTLYGITDEELHGQLGEEVRELAKAQKMSEDECYERLRQEYGGYWFGTHKRVEVYDPYHLLLAFKNKSFEPKSAERDVPAPIRDIVDHRKYVFVPKSLRYEHQYSFFREDTLYTTDEMYLLHYGYFQRGEEIGKDKDRNEQYELKFPNLEVERRFFNQLAKHCMSSSLRSDIEQGADLFYYLKKGNVKDFVRELNEHFKFEKDKVDTVGFHWMWYWGPEQRDRRTKEQKEEYSQKAIREAKDRFLAYTFNSIAYWMWYMHIKGQVVEFWRGGGAMTLMIDFENVKYSIKFYESENYFENGNFRLSIDKENDCKKVVLLIAPEGRLVAKWKEDGGPVVEVEEEEERKRGLYWGW